MAKQCFPIFRGDSSGARTARERMAKVMYPNIWLPHEGWLAILSFGGAAIASDLLNLHRKTRLAANACPRTLNVGQRLSINAWKNVR